ncbi:hypothetical protein D1BOALGB6SA_7930 [Olavius sp. associated proteobacterium Delta 1]|nr:hypothetical protein D1BOALGB6SA_7930 [Olavius sp. associated proteobacterium Delta 1]
MPIILNFEDVCNVGFISLIIFRDEFEAGEKLFDYSWL